MSRDSRYEQAEVMPDRVEMLPLPASAKVIVRLVRKVRRPRAASKRDGSPALCVRVRTSSSRNPTFGRAETCWEMPVKDLREGSTVLSSGKGGISGRSGKMLREVILGCAERNNAS